jgi:hypothetical protein
MFLNMMRKKLLRCPKLNYKGTQDGRKEKQRRLASNKLLAKKNKIPFYLLECTLKLQLKSCGDHLGGTASSLQPQVTQR